MKQLLTSIGVGLRLLWGVAIIAGIVFAVGVGRFVEHPIIDRQSRSPDTTAGYTVPHELKGVTFYVTPDEDRLIDISTVVFLTVLALAFVGLLIDRIRTPEPEDE